MPLFAIQAVKAGMAMTTKTTERRGPARATIFLGSFLVFCVQPMAARTLLPHFGGTSAVWVTCLAAFQALLLAGYWYAHRLVGGGTLGKCALPGRLKRHLALLIMAAAWLGCVAAWGGRVAGSFSGLHLPPAAGVALALLVLAGPSYLLLSANASLVQSLAGGDYRLYAVSNLGSFVGLFAYPLVLEPWVPVGTQWALLAGGMAAYAGMLWRCAGGRGEKPVDTVAGAAEAAAGGSQTVHLRLSAAEWLALALLSTFILNAATAQLTVNIAPLPLVWAALLGVYLLSWTVGFTRWGERLKLLWAALAAVSLVAVVLVHRPSETTSASLAREFAAGAGVLFFGCCALHARLCSARPSGAELTRFNLMIAVGGAAGGVLSGIAAPLVFDSILEWPLALVAFAAWCAWLAARRLPSSRKAGIASLAGVAVYAMMVWTMVGRDRAGDLARGRSFYGPWRVYERDLPTWDGRRRYRVLHFRHGGTVHGFEPAAEVDRGAATCYYAPENGGLAFSMHPGYASGKPVRAGLVGMGVGTMAWYGRAGDLFRFYEICPQVAEMAVNGPWFDFVRNSKAKVEVKVGDARRSLEAERAADEPKWDVLAVDAYSGDSIPIHLLTQEAFRLYRDRLAPGGMLALHISNWHTDLVPLAKAAAKCLGMECKVVCARGGLFSMEATWALLTEKPVELPPETQVIGLGQVRDAEVPTDAKGSLIGFVRF